MEKYINEYNKECYKDVISSTPFENLYFYSVPMSYCSEDQQFTLHTNLGSITVLDRMTGFGWRDVESGYRDMEGKFWLASGNLDVRYSGAQTIQEAIDWIKERANTCVGC